MSYLQIDAPRYSYFLDPKWCEWMRDGTARRYRGDADRFAARRQRLLRRRAPSGVTLAIHLCRGNNRSHWYAEGGYDAIAERLFHELTVDRFLLEYDDERSGSFAPLRFVPRDKTVVLGLVSSKRAALESKQDLLRRIEQAAKVIPLEQLALSPQCGFASTMEGNDLTEADQWAKLRLVVETAREVLGLTSILELKAIDPSEVRHSSPQATQQQLASRYIIQPLPVAFAAQSACALQPVPQHGHPRGKSLRLPHAAQANGSSSPSTALRTSILESSRAASSTFRPPARKETQAPIC